MSLPRYLSYTADDFVADVSVTFDAGSAITDLIGATVTVRAKRGVDVVVANSIAVAAASVAFRFDQNSLTAGRWLVQVHVSKSGEDQTVASFEIIVEQSI